MNRPFVHLLAYCLLAGIAGTLFGGVRCIEGHIYSVAAQHEATVPGQVIGMIYGKGSSAYHYVFSLNGVKMDDSSQFCSTPLAPGACDHHGPVLVYYSFEPFQNSLLEDFAAASHRAYGTGKPWLAIGLPLFVLSAAGLAILLRKPKVAPDWQLTEATIQSVNEVPVYKSSPIDVADFTYIVNDDYFSGKVRVSSSFSTHGASPQDLVNKKFQVRYNPRKPEENSVPQSELGGFLLDPYDDTFD